MSQFYGDIQGHRGEATRGGTKKSGIQGHIRGWNIGARVTCHYNEQTGQDEVTVYKTSGSGGGGHDTIICRFTAAGVDYSDNPDQADQQQPTKTITLAAKGEGRRVEELNQVTIPDLWHIAQDLQNFEPGDMENVDHTSYRRRMQEAGAAILECWHLCHDMKDNLQDPALRS